jgi:hypothetical protein
VKQELANWRVQLRLPPSAARLAAGAACRAVLQELLQKVLEVQRKSGGLVPPVAAELDNLVRFAREAALPALEIASAEQDDLSESAAVGSGVVPGVSESATKAVSGTPTSTALTLGKVSESTSDRSSEEGRLAARHLRLLVFGGDAESLLSVYLENAYKQRTARVLTFDDEDAITDDGGQGGGDQEEAIDRDVLAGLLGVSASVAGQQRAIACPQLLRQVRLQRSSISSEVFILLNPVVCNLSTFSPTPSIHLRRLFTCAASGWQTSCKTWRCPASAVISAVSTSPPSFTYGKGARRNSKAMLQFLVLRIESNEVEDSTVQKVRPQSSTPCSLMSVLELFPFRVS